MLTITMMQICIKYSKTWWRKHQNTDSSCFLISEFSVISSNFEGWFVFDLLWKERINIFRLRLGWVDIEGFFLFWSICLGFGSAQMCFTCPNYTNHKNNKKEKDCYDINRKILNPIQMPILNFQMIKVTMLGQCFNPKGCLLFWGLNLHLLSPHLRKFGDLSSICGILCCHFFH